MQIEGLDEKDNRILELLKDHARMSWSELGNAVGLSRVAVKTRVEKLEETGIIKGYHTEIDPKAVPGAVEFVMDIELDPERVPETTDALARVPEIRRMSFISGNTAVHASGFAPDTKKLSRLTDKLFYELKGVRRISFRVLLEVLKDTDGGVDYVVSRERMQRKEEPGSPAGEP